MEKLPFWRLTNPHPAFYDAESGSAIQMVAKVYAAMNELIEEHNTYISDLNAKLEAFTSDVTKDNEEFRVGLRQEFQDFIDVIDLKITEIQQYVDNFELNVKGMVADHVNTLLRNGQLIIDTEYDEATESLRIVGFLEGGAANE